MIAVVLPVVLGYLKIQIAAIAGASLMVLLGCLKMDDAYKSIRWRPVFLIAGMLPLGIAMETTGVAHSIASTLSDLLKGSSAFVAISILYITTSISTIFIPTAALVLIMCPIAIEIANELSLSPHFLVMAVAISASASFSTPVAHPVNILVMGPGSYKFTDYLKLGLPLTIIIFFVSIPGLSIYWSK